MGVDASAGGHITHQGEDKGSKLLGPLKISPPSLVNCLPKREKKNLNYATLINYNSPQ